MKFYRNIALFLFLASLSIAGCSQYSSSDSQVFHNELEEIRDELVEAPVLPADDGLPLSLEERIALHSHGELDMHLTDEEKMYVERHFKAYVHRERRYFERYLERAEVYLPYVKQTFRELGIPEELAYLAIVESGFNSNAVSRAGATGMWQFMRSTGKRYNLAQNTWLDERRDPYKATLAAGQYLLWLYNQFGDWHLAIAAYNAGEGKIGRALASTGAEDFFGLCRLNGQIPQKKSRLQVETQQYVPRFLAVCKIMRNLELLGFKAPSEDMALVVTELRVAPGTDLGILAGKSGLRWDAFKTLNPAYRHMISPPSSYSSVYVPVEHREQAQAWLARPESSAFAGWKNYKVRQGDSLHLLSRRHGVPVDLLRHANRMRGNNLRVGTTLLVPGSVVQNVQSASSSSFQHKAAAKASGGSHKVRRGESLYSISRQYGVTVAALQSANSMSAGNTFLQVGQSINIPTNRQGRKNSTSVKVADAGRNVHVVKKGDTLYNLAVKNNTSVKELMRVNGLSPNKPLLPGQELRLP